MICHGLQQHSIACGALVGEPEITDLLVNHEKYFNVLAADITDDIYISTKTHGGHHVGYSLDDVYVCAD